MSSPPTMPTMKSNRASPDLGFYREPASAAAEAIVARIEANALSSAEARRTEMIVLNRSNPAAVDERPLGRKAVLEDAVKDHWAL